MLWQHKVVRDLEWAWASPGMFAAGAAGPDCPVLADESVTAIASAPAAAAWLASLDAEPAPLRAFLADGQDGCRQRGSGATLGFYFAQLVEFWLRHCPALPGEPAPAVDGVWRRGISRAGGGGGGRELRVNSPVKVGTQTVGQLKYLWLGPPLPPNQGSPLHPVLHHLEISVKFLLRAADTAAAAGAVEWRKGATSRSPPAAKANELRRAAGGKDPAALAALLGGLTGPEIDDATDGSGKGPLHHAVSVPAQNASSALDTVHRALGGNMKIRLGTLGPQAWRGNIGCVALLLDHGAAIESISTGEFSYGKTVTDDLCYDRCHQARVRAGTNAHCGGRWPGKTPLFFALTRSRNKVVALLLQVPIATTGCQTNSTPTPLTAPRAPQRGASCRIVNNKGQSPRSLAASHMQPDGGLQPDTLTALVAAEAAEAVRCPHNMDFPSTRWPESPRIVVQCAPRASNGPNHLVFVRPSGGATTAGATRTGSCTETSTRGSSTGRPGRAM